MDFKKHALLLAVIEKLQERGSRTGKTHVQKAVFLLSATTKLPVPFEFVLYKHGPYSFDIEDELEQMKSYAAITSEPAQDGYGVTLRAGDMAGFLKQIAPLSEEDERAIEKVCAFVETKNVITLERLATAAWIRTREKIQDSDNVTARLHELKPHVTLPEAMQADKDLAPLLA